MIDEHTQKVMARVIELCGGKEKLLDEVTRSVNLINQRWKQDTETIGRVLRAHLFVEHYVEAYLKATNPNLSNLEGARLSYAQKAALIKSQSPMVEELIPGIKRLNRIRNRIAHTLQAEVNDEDKNCFLSTDYFNALRNAQAAPDTPSDDSLDVLEAFALHVGSTLDSHAEPSELSKALTKAHGELGMPDSKHIGSD